MKTKIVYVLVSGSKDYYSEQMFLSIISLRLFHLQANVTVVTDRETETYLKTQWKDYLHFLTDIISIELPKDFSPMFSSRFLKMRLRELITGDFLYLDNDTLVTGDLSAIDNCEYDLAAVPNGHKDCTPDTYFKKYLKITRKKIKNNKIPYFNGGVFYAKDNGDVTEFFSKWLELWTSDRKRWGFGYDQPTLAIANMECGYVIKSLPDIYNCQILNYHAKTFIFKAKIFHYFYNLRKSDVFPLNRHEILEEFRQRGMTSRISSIIANPLDSFLNNCKILSSDEFLEINTPLCRLARRFAMIYNWLKRPVSLLSRK